MESMPDQGQGAAEREETLESGLRMLARLIARAHLRRQGALASGGASPDVTDKPGGASSPPRESQGT